MEMTISDFNRCALGLFAAVAMLGGCGGSQSQLSPTARVAQGSVAATKTATRPGAEKIILVGSGWVAPSGVAVDDKGDFYVSDYRLGEVREVSPPFTGRTHGKMRTVAKALDSPTSIVSRKRLSDLEALRPPE
jgi:hypothetical protein